MTDNTPVTAQVYQAPPAEAIEMLRSGGGSPEQFEQVFGPGSAAKALEAQPGMLERVIKDVHKGITEELPGQIVRGAAEAVNETSKAAFGLGVSAVNAVVPDDMEVDKKALVEQSAPQIPDSWLPKEAESNTGKAINDVSQFIVGFLGAGRLLKAAGAPTATGAAGAFVQGTAKSALSSAVVFDPHQERLSNLVEQYPSLSNPVSRYLQAKPDDSEAEGRLKNALEDMFLGGAGEALFYAVKGMKLAKAGDTAGAEAAADAAESVVAKANEAPMQNKQPDTVAGVPDADPYAEAKAAETGTAAPKEPEGFQLDDIQMGKLRAALTGGEEVNIGNGIDFNFTKLTDDTNVAKTINSLSEVITKETTSAMGGKVRSWDMVQKDADEIADMIGADPQVFMQTLNAMTGGKQSLDSTVVAARTFMVSLADDVHKLAGQVMDGIPGKYGDMASLEAAFKERATQLANVQSTFKGVQTNLARSLNAMKMKSSVNSETLRGLEGLDAQAIAQRIRMANSAEGVLKGINQSGFSKAIDIHNNYWINAVLSNPQTTAVNVFSNALYQLLLPGERILAGAYKGSKQEMIAGIKQYAAITSVARDAVRMAARAFKEDRNILDPVYQTLETQNLRPLSAESLGLEKGFTADLVNGLSTAINLPTRLLSTTDEFFKQLAYRSYVRAEAFGKAAEKGIPQEEFGAFLDQYVRNSVDESGRAVDKAGLEYSRTATFTSDLSAPTFSGKPSFGVAVQGFSRDVPVMRVIIPFVRTPTNIVRAVWDRTPGVNLLRKQMVDDLAAGGQRRAQAMAKMTTGAALWVSAYELAQGGAITGTGPTNPDERKALLASGWQPYSFVINNEDGTKEYISYNRTDPFGMFFGIAADIASVGTLMEQRDIEDATGQAVVALASNLSNKSYLQGLFNAVDGLSQPDKKFAGWWHRQVGSYVPAIIAANDGDPYMREVRSTMDAVMARLPGFSEKLDPKRNVLGDKVETKDMYGPDFISPFAYSKFGDDAVATEMARISGIAGKGFSAPNKNMGNTDLTKLYRENKEEGRQQSAYDRLQELTGTLKINGRTLKENLEDMVKSDAYKKMTDGDFYYDGSRVQRIAGMIGAYREGAKAQMIREWPEFAQAFFAEQRNKYNAKKPIQE